MNSHASYTADFRTAMLDTNGRVEIQFPVGSPFKFTLGFLRQYRDEEGCPVLSAVVLAYSVL